MPEPLSFEELASAAAPPAATESKVTPAEPTPKPADATQPVGDKAKPQFTDADVTAYQAIRDLGITPETASDFVQAKQWLNTIAYAMKNDPKLLLDELRKTDPQMADKVTEVFSDDWYERKGKYLMDDKSNSGKSNAAQPEPDPRVDQLSREVAQLRSERQTEAETKRQEKINVDFTSSFDALQAKLPADLDDRTKDYIRLKAEKMLWLDPQARTRVNSGNFTDIPKYFAEASRRVTAETKAAADKETKARSGVESRGVRELPHGSENATGTAQSQPGQDPIWGNISEQEVASAYKK